MPDQKLVFEVIPLDDDLTDFRFDLELAWGNSLISCGLVVLVHQHRTITVFKPSDENGSKENRARFR